MLLTLGLKNSGLRLWRGRALKQELTVLGEHGAEPWALSKEWRGWREHRGAVLQGGWFQDSSWCRDLWLSSSSPSAALSQGEPLRFPVSQ